MSLYRTLELDVPVIQYSILHQPSRTTSVEEYRKTMLDLHRGVAEQYAAIRAAWAAVAEDVAERGVQAMRGSLLQFLTTPLQSDAQEIRRLLSEQARQVITGVLPPTVPGLLTSAEGRIAVPTITTGPLKRAAAAGRAYLSRLGVAGLRASRTAFESTFCVEGALHLDILEHIVRDRLGIYGKTHGTHIKHHELSASALHNRVYHHAATQPPAGGVEAILFFSKGEPKYAPFRSALGIHLDRLVQAGSIEEAAVWQRKLGLGGGAEFQIRLRCAETSDALKAATHMLKPSGSKEVDDALKGGSLVLRELAKWVAS